MNRHKTKGPAIFVLPLLALFFFSAASACHAQTYETVSISTYYPAPYGVYFELRAARLAVGSYYKTTGSGCYTWGGGGGCTGISNNSNLVVDGDVGIGTPTPRNALDVKGAVAIGGSYAGTATPAPVNGLVVEGNVGVGRQILFSGATPVPNGITTGNMDINDIWLRGATPPRWASRVSGEPVIVQFVNPAEHTNFGVHDACMLQSFHMTESTDRCWCDIEGTPGGSWTMANKRCARCTVICMTW